MFSNFLTVIYIIPFTIFNLISLSLLDECNIEHLHQNITNILFLKSKKLSLLKSEIQISDYVGSVKINSKYCFDNQSTCCKLEIFDLLRVVIKPLLHKLSGQGDVHRKVFDFVFGLKFKMSLLMNVLLYNVHKDLYHTGVPNSRDFMKNLYTILYADIRGKLAENKDVRVDVRELILKALSLSKEEVLCQTSERYNDIKMVSFDKRMGEIIEISILRLYRHSMRLESIISQIQDIAISKECAEELLKMVLCGVCSQKLDFTLYNNNDNIKNSNIKICPKYCYNVIRKCMAYFLSLVKTLEYYQRRLLKFAVQYKKDLQENGQKFWTDKTQQKIFVDMIQYMWKNTSKRGTICQDPSDIKESLEDYEYLSDEQDKLSNNVFMKCLNDGICETYNKNDTGIFNEILSSVDDFIKIVKTDIDPHYFVENILARSCENDNFDKCWNGKEIGQYHQAVVKFSLLDTKMNIPLTSNQKKKINELSSLIFSEVKNLSTLTNPKETMIHSDINEGSGQIGPFPTDDEDNEFEKPIQALLNTVVIINTPTSLSKTKATRPHQDVQVINSENTTKIGILQVLINERNKCRKQLSIGVKMVLLMFYFKYYTIINV